MTESALLLLTPSAGYGGGIERVADAVENAWRGQVLRVDLYRRERVASPEGHPVAKAGFAYRALRGSGRVRPRVVFANHLGLLPVAFAAARPWGAKVRSLAHGLEAWAPMSAARQHVVRRSRPLAVSSYTAARVADRAGIDVGAVPVLTLPVSPTFAAIARNGRHQPPAGRFTFLTVSRVASEHRYKGHFEVAAAMPELLRAQPDARWVVVGAGDDLERLRTTCRELGILPAVELRGEVEDTDLLQAYRKAHAFVLPSITDADAVPPAGEGFGLVYAEAGCFGLPSVASSRGGGALDFVEPDRTGLLAPPDAPEALAEALVRLAEDPGLRARLGRAARERVRAAHLPEHFEANLDRLLMEAG